MWSSLSLSFSKGSVTYWERPEFDLDLCMRIGWDLMSGIWMGVLRIRYSTRQSRTEVYGREVSPQGWRAWDQGLWEAHKHVFSIPIQILHPRHIKWIPNSSKALKVASRIDTSQQCHTHCHIFLGLLQQLGSLSLCWLLFATHLLLSICPFTLGLSKSGLCVGTTQ